jgi:putative tryptophan/tyrosine transport system substrate-binding protein
MNRRAFVTGLGAVLGAPLLAEAQQAGKVYRIGFLGSTSASQYKPYVEAMRQGLSDLGYVEGRNLTIEYRWAGGKYEQLGHLAAELVRSKVDVIVTHRAPGSQAAKQATTTIPIVMAVVGNPEEIGLVQSLARPGGNITGSSFMFAEVNAKRVQVLRDAVPALRRVAALSNADNVAHNSVLAAMGPITQSLRLAFRPIAVRQADDLEGAFASIRQEADGVVIIDDGRFIANAGRLAELAAKHRLPMIGFKELVDVGGLMAYAIDFPDVWRRSMLLVDKIFKGAKAGDLPIQRATKFELVINLKTVKALGLTIPQSLLLRADQIIE